MYIRLALLRRFRGRSPSGESGALETLFYDNDDWALRALSFRPEARRGRQALIASPMQVRSVDHEHEELALHLGEAPYRVDQYARYRAFTSEQTAGLYAYYDLPVFWTGSGVWGDAASPAKLMMMPAGADSLAVGSGGYEGAAPPVGRTVFAGGRRYESPRPQAAEHESAPPPLYAHTRLMGRVVFSPDGRLGTISDLLIDLETWRIRYLIVWVEAPGEAGEFLLSPFWVNGSPVRGRMTVPITTEAILSGPNFMADELQPLDERILARYFGFLTD